MRRQRAQSMIEFALIAIPMFMLVIGIVDFGRAIWNYNTTEFLARDIARYLVAPGHAAGDTYVLSRCEAMLSPTCSVASPPTPAAVAANTAVITVSRSTCADVTVTYAFQPASLMIANLWGGGTLKLQATSQMVVEPAQPGGCPS